MQELVRSSRTASSQCPLDMSPSKVDEEVWEGDGPIEMLSNSSTGGTQHVHFTYMLWCTGGIVPL